ncbi:MAG: hypothetical protein AAGD06_28535 [Acidobacteriota bacterium]
MLRRITYHRLAQLTSREITSPKELREETWWLAAHCAYEETRRRAWRLREIQQTAPDLDGAEAWVRFRSTARSLAKDGVCPQDALSVRFAVLLSRWTIYRSKPLALRYVELAHRAIGSMDLDPWTAANLLPLVYSQLAMCQTVTGLNGEFFARRAQRELKGVTKDRVRAETLNLAASSLRLVDRRRAIASAMEAADLFADLNDEHRHSQVRLLLADLLEEDGAPLDEVLPIVEKAQLGICKLRDSLLWQTAQLSLGNYKILAGDYSEAFRVLSGVSPFQHQSRERHRQWVLGRCRLCLGHHIESRQVFESLAREFETAGQRVLQHAVLADLAAAWQLAGCFAEARELALKAEAFFEASTDPPAYLHLVGQIARGRTVSIETVREIWRRAS